MLNVFGTIAHHPTLLREWLMFATYALTKSTLDPRTRELAVLRVGWRCDAPYEWGQHVVVGRAVGLTDDDVARVAEGPDAPGWTPAEVAALRATDELHDRATITDPTWATLAEHFSEQQILDLVFLVGQLPPRVVRAERVPRRARRRRRRHRRCRSRRTAPSGVHVAAGADRRGQGARPAHARRDANAAWSAAAALPLSRCGMPPEMRAGSHS